MERKLIRKRIENYSIKLLYTFSLVFYGLNLLFVVALLFFTDWIGDLDTGFYLPGVGKIYQFVFINIAGITILSVILAGIVLLMMARRGGAYLFYSGNILMIIYFVLRPEPDWYTSAIIVAICLLFLIPVKLIGTHSKLISGKLPKPSEGDQKNSED